jgi:non-ribosomal peptide synthetase component E (peptide arylation enzyme)
MPFWKNVNPIFQNGAEKTMSLNTPLTSPQLAAQFRAQGYWQDQTIYQRFRSAADKYPDKTAIIDGARRFSYSELVRIIDNVAGSLLALDLAPGSVVAVQSKNAAELPIMHLAAQRIGLLYMPLHDSWRDVEVEHSLKQAHACALVIPGIYRDFDHRAMIAEMRERLPDLRHVFVLGDTPSGGMRDFAELLKPGSYSAQQLAAHTRDPDAPATVMLSGGTTSLSKISRYSSNNLLNMLDAYAEAAGFGADDISAAIAPAGTGATGYVFPILTPLLHGATSVILTRWKDPAEAIDLIVNHRCTQATGIPTQLTLMVPYLEKRNVEDFAHFKVFTNAGAPLLHETADRIEQLMSCKIQSLYGATDAGTPTMTSIADEREKRLSTVGRIVRGCECELRHPDGSKVAQGETGEVVWRGPDKSWGYLGDDAATAAVFSADGFYKSGDLGQFDAEGYLRIVGRIKDMILRGGRNISPRTCEEPLMEHPSVLEVAISAMPDKVLGERACAFVMLKQDCTLTFGEMVEFLTERKIAVWQLPERLEIVSDMPRSTGAKISKKDLTAMVTQKLKAEGKLS